MRRFVYGDSYDSLAGREMGYDQARDSRYFNSLTADRADRAQAMAEQQAAAEVALRHQALQAQLAQHATEQNRFDRQMGWHEGNLALDQSKFDWTRSQPTAAEIRDKERRLEFDQTLKNQDFEDSQAHGLARSIADAGNELNAVNAKIAELSKTKSDYTEKTGGMNLPTWMGGSGLDYNIRKEYVDRLAPQLPPEVDTSKDPGADKMNDLFAGALTELQQRQAHLKAFIDNATGKGANVDLYGIDETGRYVPRFTPRNPKNPYITSPHRTPGVTAAPDVPQDFNRRLMAGSPDPSASLPPWLQTPGLPTNQPMVSPGGSTSTGNYPEGTIVRHKTTGQMFVMRNGQLVPQ